MTKNDLEICIGKYRAMLYRLAVNAVGDRFDGEDIVEEAFIRLYTCKKSFDSEEARKAWLIRVTLNLCKNRNMLRWNRGREELDEERLTGCDTPDEFIDLENALKKLKPDYRTVIFMHYYEGYSTNEIAKLLNLSVTAVTTRLKRGRDKLKEYLDH